MTPWLADRDAVVNNIFHRVSFITYDNPDAHGNYNGGAADPAAAAKPVPAF